VRPRPHRTAGQKPAHEPTIHGTDHGVLRGGLSERAVLGYDGGRLPAVLGVRREPVGGEGVGDGVHGGAHRALSFAGLHAVGEHPPVVLSQPLGHALGLDGTEQFEGFGEQCHDQVVAVVGEVQGGIAPRAVRGPVPLRRASRPCGGGALQAHFEITPAANLSRWCRATFGCTENSAASSEAVAPGCDRTWR